jgi:hypothetical protein
MCMNGEIRPSHRVAPAYTAHLHLYMILVIFGKSCQSETAQPAVTNMHTIAGTIACKPWNKHEMRDLTHTHAYTHTLPSD